MEVRVSIEGFPDSDFGGKPGGGPSRPSGRDGEGLLVFGTPAIGPTGGLFMLFKYTEVSILNVSTSTQFNCGDSKLLVSKFSSMISRDPGDCST